MSEPLPTEITENKKVPANDASAKEIKPMTYNPFAVLKEIKK